MATISDALMLGQLQSSDMFRDVGNANAVGDEAVQTLNDTGKQNQAGKGQADQTPAFQEVKYTASKDGGFDVAVKMPSSTYDFIGNMLKTGIATQNAFDEARARLAAKREFQEKNPIIAGIGKIASTAAAQYGSGEQGIRTGRISPLVRAAGAYGLDQFGQTPAELAEREAGLQAQSFAVSNQLYNQNQQQQALDQTQARENRREKTDEQRFALSYTGQLRQQARQGLFTAESADGIAQELIQAGAVETEAQAQNLARGLVAESLSKRRIDELEAKAKLDADEARELARERRFNTSQANLMSRFAQTQDRQVKKDLEEEADLLLLAKGVVDGDATSVTNFSTRTGSRAKFLAILKTLDPTMDEAKLAARVKAVKDLGDTAGNRTSGTRVQMFDTFIQHTAELEQLTQQLGGPNSPLLSKPLNKLRKEAEGNPLLFRWLVVASAVKKEYEGVLLRGRALYKDDRAEADEMLSLGIPARAVLATVKEQRKTAYDRMNSENTSYFRAVGKNMPHNVLSEEAHAALKSQGLVLPLEPDPLSGSASVSGRTDTIELVRDANGNLVEKPKK